jgi:hypothetical protein
MRRLAAGLPLLAEPRDPMEGGLSAGAWMALWSACHAVTGLGLWRTVWPDGGATTEQPALAVAMFDLITAQALEASKDG